MIFLGGGCCCVWEQPKAAATLLRMLLDSLYPAHVHVCAIQSAVIDKVWELVFHQQKDMLSAADTDSPVYTRLAAINHRIRSCHCVNIPFTKHPSIRSWSQMLLSLCQTRGSKGRRWWRRIKRSEITLIPEKWDRCLSKDGEGEEMSRRGGLFDPWYCSCCGSKTEPRASLKVCPFAQLERCCQQLQQQQHIAMTTEVKCFPLFPPFHRLALWVRHAVVLQWRVHSLFSTHRPKSSLQSKYGLGSEIFVFCHIRQWSGWCEQKLYHNMYFFSCWWVLMIIHIILHWPAPCLMLLLRLRLKRNWTDETSEILAQNQINK